MKRSRLVVLSGLFAALVGTACAADAADEAESADAPSESATTAVMATVTIESPQDGEVISGDVVVTLGHTGIDVAPIAEGRMDTGHHHVFLDVDVTPMDQPIPQGDPSIIHMGDGRASHTFEGLEPGPHRLIAVLADVSHVPLDPPAVDTVEFVIGG